MQHIQMFEYLVSKYNVGLLKSNATNLIWNDR